MPKNSITLNTSVEEIKSSVDCSLSNNTLTVSSLKEAINSEEKGSKRSSVIKFLQSRLNKLSKAKPAIDGKVEVVGADWNTARQLLAQIKLNTRLSLAGQVFLGLELDNIKKELGFTQGRKKKNGQSGRISGTWAEHVERELGVPERTARRFMELYNGAKAKLKRIGQTKVLALFDKPSSDLTKAQLTQLKDITDKITDGETQASLLVELKIAKAPQGAGATGGNLGGGNDDGDDPTMEQLAFALFKNPIHDLCNLRAHGDYEKALYALPATSPDPDDVTLATIEQQAKSLLADVREAKKAVTNK